MDLDALLTHCRLADGRLVDIGIAGGRIATIGEGAAPIPGLVDGHMHLDKTLMGLPWMPHAAGPTRMSRIETDNRKAASCAAPASSTCSTRRCARAPISSAASTPWRSIAIPRACP